MKKLKIRPRKKYMTLKLNDKQASLVVVALLELKDIISRNIKDETKDKEMVDKLCDEIITKKMDLA